MNKKLMLISILLLSMILMTSCAKHGLVHAFEKLEKEKEENSLTSYSYNEESDTLKVKLNENETDVDEFFDILEKYVEETDIGNLVFYKTIPGDKHEEYLEKFGKRLAKLSAKSIKSISMSQDIVSMDGAWTEVLGKTKKLSVDDVNLYVFYEYTDEQKARLAQVEDFVYYTSGYDLNFGYLTMFQGLKNFTLSAGFTQDELETTQGKLFGINNTEDALKPLKNMTALKTFQVYPELDGWTPGTAYYYFIFHLKRIIPKVKTNLIAASEDGEKGALVKIRNYHVLANASDTDRTTVLKDVLRKDAENAYKKGKKFKKSSKTPKLRGKVLIYSGTPFDSQFNKDKFYDMTHNIIMDELGSKKIKYPEDIKDYSTFVYIFPSYTFYGNYDKGTKGYTTKTKVAVYDMEKKIRYEAHEVNSENPPQSFTYYGSVPKRHYPSLKMDKAYQYIKKLKVVPSAENKSIEQASDSADVEAS